MLSLLLVLVLLSVPVMVSVPVSVLTFSVLLLLGLLTTEVDGVAELDTAFEDEGESLGEGVELGVSVDTLGELALLLLVSTELDEAAGGGILAGVFPVPAGVSVASRF